MAKNKPTAQAKPVKEVTDTGTPEKVAGPTFSGSQLIRAASGVSADVMSAALIPDRQYTEADAKNAVDKFLKKEVSVNGRR